MKQKQQSNSLSSDLAISGVVAIIATMVWSLFWAMPLSDGFAWWALGLVFSSTYAIKKFFLSNEETVANAVIVVTPIAVLFLASWLIHTGMFRANDYKALMSEHIVKVPNAKLPVLDVQNAPLISYDMAHSNMEKQLASGDHSSIGSQFHVGKLTKQVVKGELVWVAPLEFNSFNQWFDAGVTPGYVTISATHPEQAKVVTELNGKKLALKYVASAYFGKGIHRAVYFHSMFQLYRDFTFEIDDEGNPFWVVSKMSRKVGFYGEDATGALIVNAQTGDMQEYSIANLPKWVDRVQPIDTIEDQVNDLGEFVHGWTLISNKDKFKVSASDLVYFEGNAYWYVSITSLGQDSSNMSYMLVNSRTKETHLYQQSAISEQVASSVIGNKIKEKGWSTENALPFTIEGKAVYVAPFVDSVGTIMGYGIVDMQDQKISAIAETLQSAVNAFMQQTVNNGVISSTAERSLIKKQGIVVRIHPQLQVIAGKSENVYFLLLKDDSTIYTFNERVAKQLVLTEKGDNISIEVDKSGNGYKFDNLTLK